PQRRGGSEDRRLAGRPAVGDPRVGGARPAGSPPALSPRRRPEKSSPRKDYSVMHPFLIGQVANQRMAGLREAAAERRRAAAAAPRPRVLIRHRAGWIL